LVANLSERLAKALNRNAKLEMKLLADTNTNTSELDKFHANSEANENKWTKKRKLDLTGFTLKPGSGRIHVNAFELIYRFLIW
jgi:hypothetical protein